MMFKICDPAQNNLSDEPAECGHFASRRPVVTSGGTSADDGHPELGSADFTPASTV
jgi:hypothetical protein